MENENAQIESRRRKNTSEPIEHYPSEPLESEARYSNAIHNSVIYPLQASINDDETMPGDHIIRFRVVWTTCFENVFFSVPLQINIFRKALEIYH